MTDDPTKMPWGNIARFTAYVAAGVGSLTTWACWVAVKQARKDAQPHWTDAARWEKAGRDY